MKRTLLLASFVLGIACGSSESASSGTGGSGSGGSEASGSSGGTGGSSGGTTDPAPASDLVVGTDTCVTDADCVPDACCHPRACVGTANAPTCVDVMCTMDCQYGTLDCGGSCLCHEGHCAARLSTRPELPIAN